MMTAGMDTVSFAGTLELFMKKRLLLKVGHVVLLLCNIW
jgi:hypothetical protein